MLKQTLVAGIMGLGFMVSAPVMAHGGHGAHNHNHNWIQPARHCVSGNRVNQRQANQNRRIKQGVRSGALVKWERRELRQQQQRIKNAERRMLRDDCLTRDERNRLMNRLDRASQRIKQLKHNHVRRGNYGGRHHR